MTHVDNLPAERVGTDHEEYVRDGRSYCAICGWLDDESKAQDPLVHRWHADSFEVSNVDA